MDSEILTVAEAAGLLKVAPEIVLRLLQTNDLPGRKLEGEWRTTKRALVSFVDGVPLQMTCCVPEGCCTTESCCTPASDARGCC